MEQTVTAKPSRFERFLKGTEKLGNKIPHPMLLFIWLAIAVICSIILTLQKEIGHSKVSVTLCQKKQFFRAENSISCSDLPAFRLTKYRIGFR